MLVIGIRRWLSVGSNQIKHGHTVVRAYSKKAPIKDEQQTPSSKIKVRPFTIKPDVAKELLFGHAMISTRSEKPKLLRWAAEKIGNGYDNELNKWGISGKSLKLCQMKAVYWPTWRFSYFGETRADTSQTTLRAIVDFTEHSVPGSHASPLSLLEIGEGHEFSPVEDKNTLQPWNSTKDTKQLGSDISVSTIPFSISPFDVLDLAKDSAPRHITSYVEGKMPLKISPKQDVREVIVAAYPVYHPLYVAEYDFVLRDDLPSRRLPLVLDAYSNDPNDAKVFTPNVYGGIRPSPSEGYWANRNENRTNLAEVFPEFFDGGAHYEHLSVWLNPPASPILHSGRQDPRTVTLAPPRSPIDAIKLHEMAIPWDDIRIQEYQSSDFQANNAWVEINRIKFMVDSALRNRESAKMEEALAKKDLSILKAKDEEFEQLEKAVQEYAKIWKARRPAWLDKPGSLGTGKYKPDPFGRFKQVR